MSTSGAPAVRDGDRRTARALEGGAAGSSRRGWILAALLLLGMIGALRWTVHPWYDAENDASMYILTARSIVAGQGYSMLGQPFTIRPPGFSFLIAPLVAWRGNDFQALNLFTSLWGVAGVLLFFAFVRARLGDGLAFLLSAAVWLNPGYQRLCNQTLSDVPGFALLFALLWMERWAARDARLRRVAWLGAALGLAAYVRSGLLLLAPALGAAWLLGRGSGRDRKRSLARALVLCLAVALVQLPWSVRNARVAAPAPADQTLLHSYSTAMWHADKGDPSSPRLGAAEILGRIQLRGPALLGVLGSRMGERGSDPATLATAAVLLAFGLLQLVLRRSTTEWFVLLNVGVIAVYFGFASRLVLPVYALLLLAATESLRAALLRLLGPRRAGLALGLVAAALAAWIALDCRPRQGWDAIAAEHRTYREITDRIRERTSPEATLASIRGWHYAVYLERPVYSLQFAIERAGREEGAEALIDRYGIDTVVLSPLNWVDQPHLVYFEQRYGDQRADPLLRAYRVRPAPAPRRP